MISFFGYKSFQPRQRIKHPIHVRCKCPTQSRLAFCIKKPSMPFDIEAIGIHHEPLGPDPAPLPCDGLTELNENKKKHDAPFHRCNPKKFLVMA